MITVLDLAARGQQWNGSREFERMETHGSVVISIAVWLTMLSPLIGLIMALLGASFFSQATF
jgi:hypothetical protein